MTRLVLVPCCLLALATTACGRIVAPGAPAPVPVVSRLVVGHSVPEAISAARTALKDPAARPIVIAAFGVTQAGKLNDSVRSGWVVGLMRSNGDATRATLVALSLDGSFTLKTAKLPDQAQGAALLPTVLPSLKTSVGWAQAAGLPKAATYQVCYMADPDGPAVAVTQRTALGGDPLTDIAEEERKVVFLDPATGKSLVPAVPAPAESADEAAETEALAIMTFGVRSKR